MFRISFVKTVGKKLSLLRENTHKSKGRRDGNTSLILILNYMHLFGSLIIINFCSCLQMARNNKCVTFDTVCKSVQRFLYR